MANQLDVIVVGAGISGLAFSSVYLNAHPTAELAIIETEGALGGTWNHRRLYRHFWTQWPVGFAEFSDQPMTTPPAEDEYCGFFKAEHTSNYLEEYATGRTITSKTLKDRIQFGASVTSARQVDAGWEVDVVDTHTSERRTYLTSKFVVASGQTSIPKIPSFAGSDTFGAPIIHTLDFASSAILDDPQVKNVAVLGGGKSAADMAYACVKAGKEVTWIVRGTGVGPCNFIGAQGVGPYKSALELGSTRFAEALQPSYFSSRNTLNRVLHRTKAGRSISDAIWTHVNDEALAEADYDHRPARHGFDKLRPHTNLFWENTPPGFLNHADFYPVIADNVVIHSDEVLSLSPSTLHLASGLAIPADALLLGTGWRSSLDFLSPSLRAGLGLPYPLDAAASSSLSSSQLAAAKHWTHLEHAADAAVLADFPALAHPPPHVRAPVTHAPFRLYNLTVPVDDPTRSFACIGHLLTTNYFRTGEVQALWATAYFDGKVGVPGPEAARGEVARFVAWNRRRYLSNGEAGNVISVDTVRFTDRLLADLGLTSHLRARWWWGRVFAPNTAETYKGIREEFLAKYSVEGTKEDAVKLHGR